MPPTGRNPRRAGTAIEERVTRPGRQQAAFAASWRPHGENGFVIDRAKAGRTPNSTAFSCCATNTTSRADSMPCSCYKQLTMVEQAFRRIEKPFRDAADLPQARRDDPRPLSCSFLALVLKKALEDRIADLEQGAGSWPDVLADLNSLTETEVEQDAKRSCYAPRHAWPQASRSRPRRALPPTLRRSQAPDPQPNAVM